MAQYAWIALGGAAGAMTRHFFVQLGERVTMDYPLGTNFVNVLGCAAIGFLAAVLAGQTALRQDVQFGLAVGFLGGFTTFSAYGLQTFALLSDRAFGMALANVLVSNLLGLAAVWAGYRFGEAWH